MEFHFFFCFKLLTTTVDKTTKKNECQTETEKIKTKHCAESLSWGRFGYVDAESSVCLSLL